MKSKYSINPKNLFAKIEMEKGEIWLDNDGEIHQVLTNGRTHEQGGEFALIENLYGLPSVNMVLSNSKRKDDDLSNKLMTNGKTLSEQFVTLTKEDAIKTAKLHKYINLNKIRLFDLLAQNTIETNAKNLANILTNEERFYELYSKQEAVKKDNKVDIMQYGGLLIFKDGGLVPKRLKDGKISYDGKVFNTTEDYRNYRNEQLNKKADSAYDRDMKKYEQEAIEYNKKITKAPVFILDKKEKLKPKYTASNKLKLKPSTNTSELSKDLIEGFKSINKLFNGDVKEEVKKWSEVLGEDLSKKRLEEVQAKVYQYLADAQLGALNLMWDKYGMTLEGIQRKNLDKTQYKLNLNNKIINSEVLKEDFSVLYANGKIDARFLKLIKDLNKTNFGLDDNGDLFVNDYRNLEKGQLSKQLASKIDFKNGFKALLDILGGLKSYSSLLSFVNGEETNQEDLFDVRKLKDLEQYLLQIIKKSLLSNSELLPIKLAMADAMNRELEMYNLADVRYAHFKRTNALPYLEQINQDYNLALKSLLNNSLGYANVANLYEKKYQATNQALGQVENQNNQISNQEGQFNTQIYNAKSQSDQQARELFNENVQKSKTAQTQSLLSLNDSLSSLKSQNRLFNNNFELTQRMFLNFDTQGRFTNDLFLILYEQFKSEGYNDDEASKLALTRKKEITDSNGKTTTHKSYSSKVQEMAKDEKGLRYLTREMINRYNK